MQDESWLIVDTETDGVRFPIHAVEIAAQRMRGWRREGEPFSILLNHNVPIDPGAQAVHGYSHAYLRQHGAPPLEAHAAFHAYAGDRPMVAYNLSFDWNRVLEPEYARLGVPVAGRRGFCALTLTRRVVKEVRNYRLETIKDHFALNNERSHRGRNDVETTVTLMERIVSPNSTVPGSLASTPSPPSPDAALWLPVWPIFMASSSRKIFLIIESLFMLGKGSFALSRAGRRRGRSFKRFSSRPMDS